MSGIIGGAGSKSGVIGTTELDFEEGTWTPTLAYTGGSISSSACSYTKIGKMVNLRGKVVYGGGATDDCGLTSLPFQISSKETAGSCFTNNIKYNAFPSGDADGPSMKTNNSGTNGRLLVYAFVDSDLGNCFQNGGAMNFEITYEIA